MRFKNRQEEKEFFIEKAKEEQKNFFPPELYKYGNFERVEDLRNELTKNESDCLKIRVFYNRVYEYLQTYDTHRDFWTFFANDYYLLRTAFYATKENCYIYQAGVQYERFLKEGGLKMTFEERYNKQ